MAATIAVAGCLGSEEPPNTSTESNGPSSNKTEAENQEPSVQDARYIEAVSGHAVEVEYEDGEREVVRLAGIEAPSQNADEIDPESFYGDAFSDVGPARLRDYLAGIGEDAQTFLRRHLWDPRDPLEVELEVDPATPETDENGNRLVFIHWESPYGKSGSSMWNVNNRVALKGYARATDTPSQYQEEIQSSAENARDRKVGYWNFTR